MGKTVKYLDYAIYWLIVLLPFSMAIAPAPMSTFMGMLGFSFLLKKAFRREWLLVKTPIDIPVLLFFVITCISVLNSVNLHDSLNGGILRLLQYLAVFYIVVQEVKNKRHIDRIIFSAAAGLVMVSVDAIWQVKTGHGFLRPDFEPVHNIGLTRAVSSFKDSNTMGIYLSAFAPLVFGFALYLSKGWKKIAFIVAGTIIMGGIALTYSRPTLLAIYTVLVFFAIARRDKVLIVSLVIFTALSPFLLPDSVKKWAKEVEYNPLRFMCNDDRIAVYRNSMHMIKAHPVIGVGAGAYMKSYKSYKEFPEYRNVVTLDEMKAHNIYLHMASEIGVFGFGIFVWMLWGIFSASRKMYKTIDDDYLKVALLSLVASLIAFLVNGLTESSLYYSRVALAFWYIAALLLAFKNFTIHENK